MSTQPSQLSPENEAFLTDILARQEFVNREAALDEAVRLLRRRQEIADAVAGGVEQLDAGQVHAYGAGDLEKFLADVDARAKQRFTCGSACWTQGAYTAL